MKGEFLIRVIVAFGANKGLEVSQEAFTRTVTSSTQEPKCVSVVRRRAHQIMWPIVRFKLIVENPKKAKNSNRYMNSNTFILGCSDKNLNEAKKNKFAAQVLEI